MLTLAFGVWLHSVQLGAAIVYSVLYLQDAHLKARPKPISGRTSYLRVRLEFHRYPQVIPSRFLVSGFGPPFCVTKTSTCSRLDHSVSGLLHHTMSPYLRLAFASAPSLQLNLAWYNNSPVHSAKGTPSPINGLWLLVSTWFQYSISLPSRGSFHLSLSVLVHYRSLESI